MQKMQKKGYPVEASVSNKMWWKYMSNVDIVKRM